MQVARELGPGRGGPEAAHGAPVARRRGQGGSSLALAGTRSQARASGIDTCAACPFLVLPATLRDWRWCGSLLQGDALLTVTI